MSCEVKIKGVGKCTLDCNNKNIITKSYSQTVSGSAWKKVGTDVILIHLAGYNEIIIQYNYNHPYRNDMHRTLTYLKGIIPKLQIMEV